MFRLSHNQGAWEPGPGSAGSSKPGSWHVVVTLPSLRAPGIERKTPNGEAEKKEGAKFKAWSPGAGKQSNRVKI